MATLNDVEIEEQIIRNPSRATPDNAESRALFVPSPDDPSWNAFEAIAIWIFSVLLILIVPTLFLLPYLALQNPPITESSQIVEFAKSDPTSILLQIIAILPAHILTLLIAWLLVTRVRRYPFRQTLGWESGGFKWWHYIVILVAFFAIAAVVSTFFPEKENDLIRMLRSSRSVVYVVAFVATFTAPVVEEVVYRGILYSAFQRTFKTPIRPLLGNNHFFQRVKGLFVRINLWTGIERLLFIVERIQMKYAIQFAILFVTLIFALVHVPQYYPSYSTIFLLTLLSLTLTAVRVKSGNLLPCIILHTLFNGVQSVLLIIEPYVTPAPSGEAPAAFLYFLK